MNLVDAINTHVALKVHLQHLLQDTVDAGFDPQDAGEDNLCELGRWLYDNLTVRQDLPLFWSALHDHTAVHRCIQEVVRLHAVGQNAEAERLLHGEFTHLTHKLVHSLLELSHVVGDGQE